MFDEAGNDVTPLPLFVSDPNQVSKKQSNLLGDSSAGTVSIGGGVGAQSKIFGNVFNDLNMEI